MKVYALVGKSGTGKSFKALNVAYEYDIDLVIDDGILIYGNKYLGGKSAKREDTTIGAVKRAIFHFDDHRNEILALMNQGDYESILIIGTSIRMVEKIAKNLKFDTIDEFIFIDDISTKEEIKIAREHRDQKGKHIIPLPTLELERHFSGYLLDAIKNMMKIGNKKEVEIGEKTVIRPTFSYYGKFTISDSTLVDIVKYSTKNFDRIKINKVKIEKISDEILINIYLTIQYGVNIKEYSKNIQEVATTAIEEMTEMHIRGCNVTVSDLKIKL